MPLVESLRGALQAEDPHRACEAIDEAVDRFRKHDLDDEEMLAVSEVLVSLAGHRRWEVRRAVAHALRYVRHGAVESTLQRLKNDDAARVQKAAEESLERRAERAQLDLLPYLQDERLERMLERLPTPQTRKAALRIGAAYAEFMIRGLYHEAVRAMMPVNTSLLVLEESLKASMGPDAASIQRAQEFRTKLKHVRSILNAARMYVMEAPPEYEELAAPALIEQALTTVRSHELVLAYGLDPHVEIEPGLKVRGEPTLLQQVFENILKNAIEASAPSADRTIEKQPIRIDVSAKKVKQRAQFAFTDYGCGMTPEGLRDLFRPYRSKKRGGTGLGMPLVKKLVELDHGGSVDVTSQAGTGTTVTVTLPLR